MTPAASTNLYKHHRFPGEIISHAVWLYFRFPLTHRDVAELLFARGIIVSYEAIRKWCRKFGQQYANQPRRWRPRPSDKWHLDEVFITINKERYYLWRAVDQDGNVLDILVQRRRDKKAAKKFFRKLLKGSSPQSTRNSFSPHTVLLPNTFDRVGIVQPVAALTGATRQRECARDLAGGDFPQATALERPLDRLGSALHVMLFLENTLQTLFIFNGLRSRHCQRALLGYH
jgi:hypothetical protein